jgi:glucokinase
VDIDSGTLIDKSLTVRHIDSNSCATGIISGWSAAMKESISKSERRVTGIGVAMPGPFNYKEGICEMEHVGKFDHLYGLDVTNSLLPRMSNPDIREILYINDAAAFAMGEYYGGTFKGTRRMMALTLGTGVGSGFIADGELVVSGETVPPNGWVYNLPFEGGIADEKLSTRWFVSRYEELTGIRVAGVREIMKYAPDNRAVRQVFSEYGSRLADFIFPLYSQFEADVLILGGNIARAGVYFLPSMQESLAQKEIPVSVEITTLHENAALAGAAFQFINK